MGFEYFTLGADFVSTLEMRLVGGREFTTSDATDAPPVVMVNESFAQRFWPGQNALGQLVNVGRSAQPLRLQNAQSGMWANSSGSLALLVGPMARRLYFVGI